MGLSTPQGVPPSGATFSRPFAERLATRRPSANRAIGLWLALGLAGYLFLPWYAMQDSNGLLAIPAVFAGEDTANGFVQATRYGRTWLWLGILGLGIASASFLRPPGRSQGALLLAGGLIGAVGLALSGFLIGAKGWTSPALATAFGELSKNQFGMGWGAFVVLASLVMLTA